jgi:hypothetical protein
VWHLATLTLAQISRPKGQRDAGKRTTKGRKSGMLTSDHLKVLELPRVYLVRMAVFTILICIVGAVLYPNIQVAFMANPGLNGMILLVLLLGIAYTFRMVFRLWPEVNWVNSYRIADPGLEVPYKPTLAGADGRTAARPVRADHPVADHLALVARFAGVTA